MFKFATIGAFDVALNVPECKLASTAAAAYNGNGVTVDKSTKALAYTTSSNGATDPYVVMEVVRKFDYDNSVDVKFESGKELTVYRLASIDGYEVEFTNDTHILTSALTSSDVGKVLAYGANGKMAAVSSASADAAGTKVGYKVLALTGKIVRALVVHYTVSGT